MSMKSIISTITIAVLLQGCVAAAVVGVVGGASVATDNRSLGNQIDDQKIEIDAQAKLRKSDALSDNTNLQVISVNGSVLVIGQAPNSYLRDQAIKAINEVNGVKQLHNQIRVSNTTSFTTKTNDVWLTSKVKTSLFGTDKLDATNIKVVTENGEVFLMGLVTKEQATIAVEIARNVSGVNRVFKIFEYVEVKSAG
ncbi:MULTISPECIES: division/outer membrane stress-associated lipid-binding lipoprotein [unclassified Colwellia]|jgi:osmotically-inducible protein OsmY|uniref:division/outer membrane stress-associated lipid-binding lipoprotein n=1 Tax=unclassified Colwellia TaxID=196834 RepID=UPI001EF3B4AD|nr:MULTISPECIES: division/outer membrane stress-associated lipid-binding lipoprotein [unclassified Colwellia]|tara:strand:- start:2597 stop:3184 length:588 start_codon:yes stop_codon:yes gene_type:complete|eukprot:GHVR01108316.1.p1 GENE.GHVR01108316.1~~GHVR01108316.1.p1  ORF type:complete len:196 (-),score=20.48 GHVR01108316.1:162-749(-)